MTGFVLSAGLRHGQHVLAAHLTRSPEARTSGLVHVRDLSGPVGGFCSEGKMISKYRIEIELLLDESAATGAMELARDVYRQRGGARTVEDGVEREMSAEEFIDSAEEALLELVEGNLLRLRGIVIGHENCRQLLPEVEAAGHSRT